MNGFEKKIDEIVRQRSSAQMHESREPCEPGGFGMAANLVGRLGCDAPSIAIEFMRKHAAEQITISRTNSNLANSS